MKRHKVKKSYNGLLALRSKAVRVAGAAGLCVLLSSATALASGLCESASNAQDNMSDLAKEISGPMFDKFLKEIATYIDYDFKTATAEITDRLQQYDVNLYPPLEQWWDNTENKADKDDSSDDDSDLANPTSTLAALKAMTRQISMAKIEQTRAIGSMFDARMLNEKWLAMRMAHIEGTARYTPAETTCQIDRAAKGQNIAYYQARALTKAITREDTLRRLNYVAPVESVKVKGDDGTFIRSAYAATTPRVLSGAGEMAQLYQEYAKLFCDQKAGDQGCATATVPFPGLNRDIPSLLWGDKQTQKWIDTSNQAKANERREAAMKSLRTLVDPFTPPPVSPSVISTAAGREELARRRAWNARINTLMNSMTHMMAERVGGSNTDMVDIKTATGLQPDADDKSASYSAIRAATAKSRYLDPKFIPRLMNSPGALAQEQIGVNATQLSLLYDLWQRSQEGLYVQAATYADALDGAMPSGTNSAVATP